MTDPRELRFLASQSERLAGHKKQQDATCSGKHSPGGGGGDVDAPELSNDVTANDGADGAARSKEESRAFWRSFRSTCSELRGRIDTLLFIPPPSVEANDEDAAPKTGRNVSDDYGAIRAHYVTASRRNDGRAELDSILTKVRRLQRHVLSSSSLLIDPGDGDRSLNGDDEELQSVLRKPMPDVTQTDVRLISQEIEGILKRIDDARDAICPKEKFVFKRYRKAMEERARSGGGSESVSAGAEVTEDDEKDGNGMPAAVEKEDRLEKMRSAHGGVLEGMSKCTVEISPDGTILVGDTSEDQTRRHGAPRPIHELQPGPRASESRPERQGARESTSYLLRDLRDVTVVLHGSRPSLHLQNIHNCRICATTPVSGPVHVTDCHSSQIRCSCYQLRVHDSSGVRFGVWVRSGPIIEDCTGMVFEGDFYDVASDSMCDDEAGGGGGAAKVVGRNMYWDVKDFNWLRTLRKSPNFIVVDGSSSKTTKVDVLGSGSEGGVVEPAPAPDEEEDSEDEL